MALDHADIALAHATEAVRLDPSYPKAQWSGSALATCTSLQGMKRRAAVVLLEIVGPRLQGAYWQEKALRALAASGRRTRAEPVSRTVACTIGALLSSGAPALEGEPMSNFIYYYGIKNHEFYKSRMSSDRTMLDRDIALPACRAVREGRGSGRTLVAKEAITAGSVLTDTPFALALNKIHRQQVLACRSHPAECFQTLQQSEFAQLPRTGPLTLILQNAFTHAAVEIRTAAKDRAWAYIRVC